MLVGSKSGVSRGTHFDWLSHQEPSISGTQYTHHCIACFALLGASWMEFFQIFTKYITYNSLIVLGNFYNFRRPFCVLSDALHMLLSHIGLLFQLGLELAPHTNIPVLNNILIDCFSAAPHLTCLEEWWASGFSPDTLCTQKYLFSHILQYLWTCFHIWDQLYCIGLVSFTLLASQTQMNRAWFSW